MPVRISTEVKKRPRLKMKLEGTRRWVTVQYFDSVEEMQHKFRELLKQPEKYYY